MYVDPYVQQHHARTERLFSRMDQQIEDWRRRFPEGSSLRDFKVGASVFGTSHPSDQNAPPSASSPHPAGKGDNIPILQSSRILRVLDELSTEHQALKEDHDALRKEHAASQAEARSLGAQLRSSEVKWQTAFSHLQEIQQATQEANATLEKRVDIMERLFCGDKFNAGIQPRSGGGDQQQFAELTALLRELVAGNGHGVGRYTSASDSGLVDRQIVVESKVAVLEAQLRDERTHHRKAMERAIADAVEETTLAMRREMERGDEIRMTSATGGSRADFTNIVDTSLSLNTPPSWGRFDQKSASLKKRGDKSTWDTAADDALRSERRRRREQEDRDELQRAEEERKQQLENERASRENERRAAAAHHENMMRLQDEKRLEQAAEIQRRFEEAQRSYATTLHNARLRKDEERAELVRQHREATQQAKDASIVDEISRKGPLDLQIAPAPKVSIPAVAVPTLSIPAPAADQIPLTQQQHASIAASQQTTSPTHSATNQSLSSHSASPLQSERSQESAPSHPLTPIQAAGPARVAPVSMIPSSDSSAGSPEKSPSPTPAAMYNHAVAQPVLNTQTSANKVLASAFESDSTATDDHTKERGSQRGGGPSSKKSPTKSSEEEGTATSSSSEERAAGYRLPQRSHNRPSAISPSSQGRPAAMKVMPSLFGGPSSVISSGSGTAGTGAAVALSSVLGGPATSTRKPIPKVRPLAALLRADREESSDETSSF